MHISSDNNQLQNSNINISMTPPASPSSPATFAHDHHNNQNQQNHHQYNHHMYTTPRTSSEETLSSKLEKLTLCGFEGPEKLLEIWFKPSTPLGRGSVDVPTNLDAEEISEDDDDSESTSSTFSSNSGVCALEQEGSAYRRAGTSRQYARKGLRTVNRDVWEGMLDIVKCQVLSVLDNEFADAYLLSESSMFIYPNRLVLKTCGTTTLLNAVPRIFEIARDYCGMVELDALFYSRKAFLFPDRQVFPHGRWGDEVAYLDELFPEDEGFETSGYVIGKINGDHWCLYTALPSRPPLLNKDGDEITDGDSETGTTQNGVFSSSLNSHDDSEDHIGEDVTIEIMMQDLNPKATRKFWRTPDEIEDAKLRGEKDGCKVNDSDLEGLRHYAGDAEIMEGVFANVRKAERRLLKETRISEIYPDSIVDDFLFDPCGYSLNGLVGNGHFYTIHVTPEDICSYASFETSVPTSCVTSLVEDVLRCFEPGRFTLTIFTRGGSHRMTSNESVNANGTGGAAVGVGAGDTKRVVFGGEVDGFRKTDDVSQRVGGWDLSYCHFVKC